MRMAKFHHCYSDSSSGSWALPRRCFCSCLRRRLGPTTPGQIRRPATGPARLIGAAGLPTSNANADIFNGGTATVTTTGDVCSVLSLGNTAGSGTVQMTGGSLTVSNSTCRRLLRHGELYAVRRERHDLQQLLRPRFGYQSGGNGTYSLSGGTNTIVAQLDLGYSSGSSGTYSLSGTGQLRVNGTYSAGYYGEYVGFSGTGSFTQSGGTNADSEYINPWNLLLGYNSGSSGSYGLWGTGYLSVPAPRTWATMAGEISPSPEGRIRCPGILVSAARLAGAGPTVSAGPGS